MKLYTHFKDPRNVKIIEKTNDWITVEFNLIPSNEKAKAVFYATPENGKYYNLGNSAFWLEDS